MWQSENDRPAGAVRPLACHIEGAGPPLVLLHGGMGSWTHWIRNIPVLRERFTVYAPDLPGCGDSFSVPDDIDAGEYVGMVCRAIDELVGGGAFGLAGFSFGGVIAAMMAVRMAPQVRRLALLAPGGFGHASGRNLDLRKMPAEPATDAQRREVLRHNLMALMLARAESADDPTIEIQRANVMRARYDTRRFSLRTFTRDALPHIGAPAMLIYGEDDNLAWPSIQARIDACRSVKPALRVESIALAGHWVQYEASHSVNRLLMQFFA